MSYSQKKSSKFGHHKGKALEAAVWDHSGFDLLQKEQENSQKNDDRYYRNKKPDRDLEPKSQAPDYPYKFRPPTKDEESGGKWQHDKFELIQNSTAPPSKLHQTHDSQNTRKKRPDMPLYSARSKHNRNGDTPNTNTSATLANDISTPKSLYSKTIATLDNSDVTPFEDDAKSIASNVSTAFSERIKSNEEDIFTNRDSNLGDRIGERMENKKDDSHVLFEITLDNDRFSDNIKVYDNEEDYESFLDNICY